MKKFMFHETENEAGFVEVEKAYPVVVVDETVAEAFGMKSLPNVVVRNFPVARLKSNGKLYKITEAPFSVIPTTAEFRAERTKRFLGAYPPENFKKSFISLQPLNPKTGKPWQASRRYSLDAVEVL